LFSATRPPGGATPDNVLQAVANIVDQSGKLWVTNNWKIEVDPFQNPGGNAGVILVGAAAPLKQPAIGPPSGFR
jgi:hypothetical protein